MNDQATRWIAFNGPRTTTTVGVVLLLGLAALAAGQIPRAEAAPVTVGLVLLVAASLVASPAMLTGRTWRRARLGWALGSLASFVSIVLYLASRTVGLPGLPALVDRWDTAGGTVAVGLAAAFLVLHLTILREVTVARTRQRRWHD